MCTCLPLQTECLNYIRVLQPLGASALYVCGTNAFQPTCDHLVRLGTPRGQRSQGRGARGSIGWQQGASGCRGPLARLPEAQCHRGHDRAGLTGPGAHGTEPAVGGPSEVCR